MAATTRITSLRGNVRFNNNALIRLATVTGQRFDDAFYKALNDVHQDAADAVAAGMVVELQKRVKATGRAQRGDNRLAMSLLSDNNQQVNPRGFAVLLPRWMNRSPARLYWRRIEEGDTATFGAQVLFTNDFGRFSAPYSPGGSRSDGTRKGLGRRPAGYKHMRMPQHRGVYVAQIGPYPEYAYTQGGIRARNAINFADKYRIALASRGIKMEKAMFR